MLSEDVADSTDWLSTPLSGLAVVEAALRCQVCKDFYKTPMITSCSHTFCSLCIRRALSNDGRCPLCRASDQEVRLRSNWSLEETTQAFTNARKATLNVARSNLAVNVSPKRTAGDAGLIGNPPAPETKRVRTSARLSKSRVEFVSPPPLILEDQEDQEDHQIVEASDDDEYVLKTADGLVPCPSCQRTMKAWQVFKHLESCPGPTTQPDRGQSSSRPAQGQLHWQQQRTLERLPFSNYSMMKEKALRKKLIDLGIPNQGPRHLLEKRHKEWITIWNANCDAVQPRKHSELLRDLDEWERTQDGRGQATSIALQNAVVVKDRDFDGAAWAAKHDSSFKDLIQSARKSRLEALKKASEGQGMLSFDDQPVDVQTPSSLAQPLPPIPSHKPEVEPLQLNHTSLGMIDGPVDRTIAQSFTQSTTTGSGSWHVNQQRCSPAPGNTELMDDPTRYGSPANFNDNHCSPHG